jgi:hypothetical protein
VLDAELLLRRARSLLQRVLLRFGVRWRMDDPVPLRQLVSEIVSKTALNAIERLSRQNSSLGRFDFPSKMLELRHSRFQFTIFSLQLHHSRFQFTIFSLQLHHSRFQFTIFSLQIRHSRVQII